VQDYWPRAGLPGLIMASTVRTQHFRLGRFIAAAEAFDPHGDSDAQEHFNNGF
jgi:hypothetical protein